jgi:hypothetical protein
MLTAVLAVEYVKLLRFDMQGVIAAEGERCTLWHGCRSGRAPDDWQLSTLLRHVRTEFNLPVFPAKNGHCPIPG